MYIDPNTGGMLFQVLAILFGVFSAFILFFAGRIRIAIARFRRSLKWEHSQKIDSTSDDDYQDEDKKV